MSCREFNWSRGTCLRTPRAFQGPHFHNTIQGFLFLSFMKNILRSNKNFANKRRAQRSQFARSASHLQLLLFYIGIYLYILLYCDT